VVFLQAIGAFQRHSTQHLLHYWSLSGPVLFTQPPPSGCVQRTGCSACGLGYPHQVWWAPPMYMAPVGFAGMSTCLHLQPPPGLSPRFLPTAGFHLKKWATSAQKSGSPTGTRPSSVIYSFSFIPPPPPRGGGSRSGNSPCCLGRTGLLLYISSCNISRLRVASSYPPPLPPVHLPAWPSCYLTQFVYRCIRTSVRSLARSHLLSSKSLSPMAGLAINPVQVFSTLPDLHWEFLRLWTGFELPSSYPANTSNCV
jgi:hypothetical protein